MQKLIGLGLSVLVNAVIVSALMWSALSTRFLPNGEVFVTDLNDTSTRMIVASH